MIGFFLLYEFIIIALIVYAIPISKPRKTVFIVAFIGLWFIDAGISYFADYRLLVNKYNFETRLAEVNLKQEEPPYSICKVEYKFLIYPYKTCFYRSDRNKNPDYRFKYSKTSSRIWALFLIPTASLYDRMTGAPTLYVIAADGKVTAL